MVNITIQRSESYIRKIVCQGHASSDAAESDLICAGLTAITSGACNAIDQIDNQHKYAKISCEEGYVMLEVTIPLMQLTIVLETVYWQLKTLAEQYSSTIAWKEIPINDEV